MEAVFWIAVALGLIVAGLGFWLGIAYRKMLKEQAANDA